MIEQLNLFVDNLLTDLAGVDRGLVLVSIVLVAGVMMLDAFSSFRLKRRKQTGLHGKLTAVSVDGSPSIPVKHYRSEIQGLSGKPDALIRENGYIIPVERKPLARKLRDRYVAQLLVYMRLVEEFEGQKPPYGYLILGANARRIKVENTETRQAWLQTLIDEMHAIIAGKEALASPHQRKCQKCDVSHVCQFKICPATTTKSPGSLAIVSDKSRQ